MFEWPCSLPTISASGLRRASAPRQRPVLPSTAQSTAIAPPNSRNPTKNYPNNSSSCVSLPTTAYTRLKVLNIQIHSLEDHRRKRPPARVLGPAQRGWRSGPARLIPPLLGQVCPRLLKIGSSAISHQLLLMLSLTHLFHLALKVMWSHPFRGTATISFHFPTVSPTTVSPCVVTNESYMLKFIPVNPRRLVSQPRGTWLADMQMCLPCRDTSGQG